jgi:PIN domain nuclease of toxin-antitoxin system
VVLDTCALLWWTLQPEKLSPLAELRCSEISKKGASISSISLWEIGIKAKRGDLDLGMDWREYLDRVDRIDSLKVLPVTERILRESLLLEWEHVDFADKVIVATAKLDDEILLTADADIRGFYAKAEW